MQALKHYQSLVNYKQGSFFLSCESVKYVSESSNHLYYLIEAGLCNDAVEKFIFGFVDE